MNEEGFGKPDPFLYVYIMIIKRIIFKALEAGLFSAMLGSLGYILATIIF